MLDVPHGETPPVQAGADDGRRPLSDPDLAVELLALLPVGVVVHARDGTVVDASTTAETVLGLDREQLLGREPVDPRWAAVHRDGTAWPGHEHPASQVLATGEPATGLMGVDVPDRGRVWLQVHAVGHRTGPDGLPALVVATFVDVTARVAAEDEAEERRQELAGRTRDLQRLHAVIAHDLRTPLTAVRGYTDLLRRRAADALGPQPREWLDAVDRAARRLESMFDGLLALTRVGARPGPDEPVDLDEVLDATLESLRGADHHLEITRAPLGVVVGDAALLGQLLDNLLGNAVRHAGTDRGVHVEVRAEPRDDGRVDLVVVDHGPGIPPGSRDRAVQMFQRLAGPGGATGSGVGLAVCQEVARRHGGRLELGDTPGGGLTVRVDLPLPVRRSAGEASAPTPG